jgi:hypothetical protein
MDGINRISIKSDLFGSGAWRFKKAAPYLPWTNALYRAVFKKIGHELAPGEATITCSKEEFTAGYDYQLGIDVILCTTKGEEMTLQEKFLYKGFDTVTVEHFNDWRTETPGDWHNMKTQFYFVGDDVDHNLANRFDPWILLDWPATKLRTDIPWHIRKNQNDGARADFKFAPMGQFPPEVVVACSWDWHEKLAYNKTLGEGRARTEL